MSPTLVSILCAVVAALVSSCLISPLVLLAYRKNLVDKPEERKLQSRSVPVLGGVSVFVSLTVALSFALVFLPEYVVLPNLLIAFLALTLMFMTGLYDDLVNLSFHAKFILEIVVITLLWYAGFGVDSLAGLFGVCHMSSPLSLLFSLVIGVGLINALNMLDGVDGLASSFGIVSGIIIGTYFLLHGFYVGGCLAGMVMGALIPFFVCNVFSLKYKMFIGDSGSLVIGVLVYIAVCCTLHLPARFAWDDYRISLLLSVYALPVYDTLRVMFTRLVHRHSPFLPDRTHLHHAFVELQYPHLMITIIELTISLGIFAVWVGLAALCQWLHISAVWNLVANLVVGIGVVQGTYFYVQYLKLHNSDAFARHVEKGHRAGRRIDKPVSFIRSLIDGVPAK